MLANDWSTGGAVKTDFNEEIVQEAVADDEYRRGVVAGIQDAKDEGDEAGAASLTALLDESDRRRRVLDRVRTARKLHRVGDYLGRTEQGPATLSGLATDRQAQSRAFAAEFLAPADPLRQRGAS